MPAHDHTRLAPWEEKFLPEEAIGEVCIRVFIYENEFIEEVVEERIGAACDSIDGHASTLIDLQRRGQPFGDRRYMPNDKTRPDYEWYFEPLQK